MGPRQPLGLLLTILVAAAPIVAQGTFTGLGAKDTHVTGMSADGSVAPPAPVTVTVVGQAPAARHIWIPGYYKG